MLNGYLKPRSGWGSSRVREFESGKTLDPAVAGPASGTELQNFRTCIQWLSKVSESAVQNGKNVTGDW